MAKKTIKKWNRVHFFKRKKSTRRQVGHPTYVYGARGRDYKYLVITHTPEKNKESEYVPLKHNIDPDDPSHSYLHTKFRITHKEYFEDPPKKYRFHPDDVETVKKYKK